MSTTPYAILGLLSIEPMAGYDIRRNLEESVSYFWSESYGQIYPALKKLEASRLITPVRQTASNTRGRKLYALTTAGRERLRTWLAEPPKPQPPRNELLLKLFFGRQAPPGACAAHLRRLRVQQERLTATLEGLEKQLRSERRGHPDLKYWLVAVSSGIDRAQALLDWSERALRALENQR
jgi:PadR family transcriptional regulator, regulatory protein AphA